MLYTTHLSERLKFVPVLSVLQGDKVIFTPGDYRHIVQQGKLLAKQWRNRYETPCRAAERSNKDYEKFQQQFQWFVTFEFEGNVETCPVDHIGWKTPSGRLIQLEFSGFGAYLSNAHPRHLRDGYDCVNFKRSTWRPIKEFACAIQRIGNR